MNPIAEMALASARARQTLPPTVPVVVTRPVLVETTRPVQLPAPIAHPERGGHFSRVLFLEGRRHAADLVRDMRGLLQLPGGKEALISRLRECMQEKPSSFAQGVAAVITLLEAEVANG